MANEVKSVKKYLTWIEVNKMMAVRGWNLVTDEKRKKEWIRRNEKVSVFRTFDNRWKAEFFAGKKLQDSTGTHNEFFAKVMTIEFAAFK